MVVMLKKGQRINLTKEINSLKNIIIGLGWDTKEYDGGNSFDLDASAFLLNESGVCNKDKDFIFYGNLQSEDGSVLHLGDNRTGEGDGDDEQISINLDSVPSEIDNITITVTIYESEERGQNFGQVENAFVRLVDEVTGEELVRFDLGEDFSIETAIVFCELYREENDWKFKAVGSGYNGGLESLVTRYGLTAG